MTVRVGPGNDWEDVHNALKGTNVTVVGGRIGEVGVGGYVVGGGLSFLSAQYGWAANNIVEFEVVLANATIVTASNTTNPDLYKALKGGGNAFGIVTAFTMIAHPQGQVWGGNLIFTPDKTDQMLAAVRDFTEYYPDEKAGIIMTAELSAVGVIDMWILFLLYDGPTPPLTRSYSELLTYNNFAVVKGSIYTITTEMIPVPSSANGAEVLGAVHDNWRNTSTGTLVVSGIIASIAYQPVPKMLARKAREMGGDMIDLDDDVDRLIIEFNYSYWFNTDDAKMDTATQQLYKGTKDIVARFREAGKLPQAFLPLFANDGYFRQDYWGRLRTADFARSAQSQYDPDGFFAKRTGGYKL
ncbi:hypothetical protein CC80DRAFT_597222 [Byssothecium circinans]|uniref:FAD-binding PCMH-type domain-containing protein n=1 Tax=Byssothecium circinans TaxID=147558 RepID=A0A6A5THX5_9PLEO|nr:hypothetical protein CC80DRAFT_597222 [Byssothecium circinans]